jgi:hypothetical protein
VIGADEFAAQYVAFSHWMLTTAPHARREPRH